jgi:hypothetical protein
MTRPDGESLPPRAYVDTIDLTVHLSLAPPCILDEGCAFVFLEEVGSSSLRVNDLEKLTHIIKKLLKKVYNAATVSCWFLADRDQEEIVSPPPIPLYKNQSELRNSDDREVKDMIIGVGNDKMPNRMTMLRFWQGNVGERGSGQGECVCSALIHVSPLVVKTEFGVSTLPNVPSITAFLPCRLLDIVSPLLFRSPTPPSPSR